MGKTYKFSWKECLIILVLLLVGLYLLDNFSGNTYYDLYGNQYSSTAEIPLYDHNGNKYTYNFRLVAMGDYVDQDGNVLDGDYCYLDSDGYLVYNENLILNEADNYYSYDEEGNSYYNLDGRDIYWDKDGNVYVEGRYEDIKVLGKG